MNILIPIVKERGGGRVEGICGVGGKEIRGVKGGGMKRLDAWILGRGWIPEREGGGRGGW